MNDDKNLECLARIERVAIIALQDRVPLGPIIILRLLGYNLDEIEDFKKKKVELQEGDIPPLTDK